MKNIHKAIVSIVFVFAASPALAQNCNGASIDQTTMNQCAMQVWERADKDLNAAYRQAMARARQLDSYTPEGEVPVSKLLRSAQRAWIDFRDLACSAESAPMRGGSARPLLHWGCMTRLTRNRTEDLRIFAGF